MKHTIVWFEIPVKDFDRAVKFYSTLLSVDLKISAFGEAKMAFFPHEEGVVSGALVEGNGTPSETGPLIYLNGGDNLEKPLSRVKQAGGTIVQEKMSIGPYGFIALFVDTEGNRIGLHSMK